MNSSAIPLEDLQAARAAYGPDFAAGTPLPLGQGLEFVSTPNQIRMRRPWPFPGYRTAKVWVTAVRSTAGDVPEAILIGPRPGFPEAHEHIRIHSVCKTSALYHSAKCDCAEERDFMLGQVMGGAGWLMIFFNEDHEGRGIGLFNKLRAYALQELKGLDTVEANRHIGEQDDTRDYSLAVRFYLALGHRSIALVTNNPAKGRPFAEADITVQRVPIVVAMSGVAAAYVATKTERMGHQWGKIPVNDGVRDFFTRWVA